MELKDALTAWKKAKPLTLTKTGVSEALRLLPAEPKSEEDYPKAIAVLDKVLITLKAAEANKHIQKETKAHACIKDILTEVNKKVASHKSAVEKAKQAKAAEAARLKKEKEEREKAEAAKLKKEKEARELAEAWKKAFPLLKRLRSEAQAFADQASSATATSLSNTAKELGAIANGLPAGHPQKANAAVMKMVISLTAEYIQAQKAGKGMDWVIKSMQPIRMLVYKLKDLKQEGPAPDLTA